MNSNARYDRQARFGPLGESGQLQLGQARVLICGCGALGGVIANTLARAGVGYLRIIDRDLVDWTNLQRQVLFTEEDVSSGLPKAIAISEHLRRINSEITIDPHVADLHYGNIGELISDIDIIADGTDNLETRFLLNDASFHFGIPWVFGGCLGSEGQTMTIVPGQTPCLRCVIPEPPPAELTPTCETAGILAPVVNCIASLQAMEIIKLASGNLEAINRHLTIVDVWTNRIRQIRLEPLHDAGTCPTCEHRRYEWLDGTRGSHTTVLCGRNSVQVTPRESTSICLETLADRLSNMGTVIRNRYLIRVAVDRFDITVFPDGRAIVGGTSDPTEARRVLARCF